jgi:lysophospholipase L1-like esterase
LSTETKFLNKITKQMKRILLTLSLCMLTLGAMAQKKDWAAFGRYEKANKEVTVQPTAVFMGNSITEGWANKDPEFFKKNNLVGRGISGQTSEQFLLRFRNDVINLKPAKVVINVGTNDVAENTRPYDEDYTFGNIVSMVQLARANKIKVVLAAVLPAAGFSWRKDITDAPDKIEALNARIKAYAKAEKIPFVDYYTPMVYGEKRQLNPDYTYDGVHPTAAGYEVMESLVQKALK